MLKSDVDTLISFVSPPLVDMQRWRALLQPLDALQASNTILDQRKTGEEPTIEWFRQAYGMASKEPPATIAIPEWVQVWWWARRTEVDDRGFPQQYGETDREQMLISDYTALLARWVAAGRLAPRNVAALIGNA